MVTHGTATEIATEIAVLAIGAAVAAVLARRLRQPTVVGFLVAGLVMGPLLGLVRTGSVVAGLGELGVALLLFLVGVDLSYKEIRAVGPPALLAAVGQLAGSAAGGFLLARALGFDATTSAFLAAALAFSSTVVVVKILVDLGDMERTYGRLSVGIFLVQDVFVILLLTLLPVIGDGSSLPPPLALGGSALLALAQLALLVVGAVVASRTVLPVIFEAVSSRPPLLLLVALTWLSGAIAATQVLEVSVEAGAFVAGLSLAPLPYANELRRRVRPLLDLFLALFFVSLAAGVDVGQAVRLLPAALAFSAFVLLGKGVLLTTILALRGYARETSLRTGITIGQVSEFSIVLAALATAQGLISEAASSFVVLVAMITIASSGILIWHSGRIAGALERFALFRRVPDGARDLGARGEAPPEDHVLVLGWDAIARRVARRLVEAGERVVVLDAHHHQAANGEGEGAETEGLARVYADAQSLDAIESAGFARAKAVVVNVQDPDLARVLAERKGPRIILRADDERFVEELRGADVEVVMPPALVAREATVDAIQEAERDG